jgi:hypothetical protein
VVFVPALAILRSIDRPSSMHAAPIIAGENMRIGRMHAVFAIRLLPRACQQKAIETM